LISSFSPQEPIVRQTRSITLLPCHAHSASRILTYHTYHGTLRTRTSSAIFLRADSGSR
jgi:hypothetical protein